MPKSTLIVGASGWLGRQVAEAMIARDLPIRIALRGGTSHAKASGFDGRADVVAADLADPASLAEAVRDVGTIVSVVQGGPAEIVAGQVALAKAGLEAGAKRIVPSDFAVDFRGVSTDRHLFLGLRAEADRQIAALGLAQANILNGAFVEVLALPFFEMMEFEKAEVRFYGDADQPYDFTATKDVAAFVAEVVRDEERVGPQMIVTERVSARQLADLASTAFGRPFALTQLGGLDQLDAEIAARQAANPQNPMAWAALQYQRLMATGESVLALPVSSTFVAEPLTIAQFFAGMVKR